MKTNQPKMNIILKYSAFIITIFISACNTTVENKKTEQIISEVSSKFVPDKRVAIFNIEMKENYKTFILKGETDQKDVHNYLLDTLTKMNIQVIDSVRILPDVQLGEKTWGLVTLSVIPMRKDTEYSAEMVSQAIMGTPVKLLDKKEGWYLVQTPDLYIGWINSSGISQLTETEISTWKSSDRYIFTAMSGLALSAPMENASTVSDLLMGCIFEVESKTNGFLKIKFPDGREGFTKASDCAPLNKWQSAIPDAKKIISTAKNMLGYPYLWGAASTKSVDCSGLIKTSYFSQGIILSRDASQQALFGEELDINNPDFQPGDLLFFGRSKERITHVALYMGDDHYIHSAGSVKINSLNAEDKDFNPRRKKAMVAACRILNSLNNEQITPIKDHPWYN